MKSKRELFFVRYCKRKQKEYSDYSEEKTMTIRQYYDKKGPRCHQCGRFGHIERNCRAATEKTKSMTDDKVKPKGYKHKANTVEPRPRENTYKDESVGLVVQHALTSNVGKATWIIDSGATTHMRKEGSIFVVHVSMKTQIKIVLGDGYEADAIGRRTVALYSELSIGDELTNVLHVLKVLHNLLNVSRATCHGKIVQFDKTTCTILDDDKLVAVGTKIGDLYYLKCHRSNVYSNMVENQMQKSKEDYGHCRF